MEEGSQCSTSERRKRLWITPASFLVSSSPLAVLCSPQEMDTPICLRGKIRGCHNRNKGTAENERLRDPKLIFSYPKNERLIFLCGRNAAQEEISTMRVG